MAVALAAAPALAYPAALAAALGASHALPMPQLALVQPQALPGGRQGGALRAPAAAAAATSTGSARHAAWP